MLNKDDVMHLWFREPDGNDYQEKLYRFARAVMDADAAKMRVDLSRAESTIAKLNNRIAVEVADRQKFKLGDLVRKTRGSQWHGRVVGFYSTELTPIGYAVESSTERGSVQIYPESALEKYGT
jgi:dihydrofolate reductase (trimethoprim resistance protein)